MLARARLPPGLAIAFLAALAGPVPSANAFPPEVMESVVSVLPLWPGYAQGTQPRVPPGTAPEGTAVAILAGGYLVTALHVVERAVAITLRLSDGRLVPAEVVGQDPATDLALLKTQSDLPLLPDAPDPALGASVCGVGNQFGLGLSVTCGVVSAKHRSGVGFNPIEDFIQTDAAIDPGASGGALVDGEGRLAGIVSAIFTKETDANIGVNFAVSIALVRRVVEDLATQGRVIRGHGGMRVDELSPAQTARAPGALVVAVTPGGAAARAGLKPGDIITAVGGRAIRRKSDVTSALALLRVGEGTAIAVRRAGVRASFRLVLSE